MFQGRMSTVGVVGYRRLVEEQVQLRGEQQHAGDGPMVGRVIEYTRDATSPPPLESPATNRRDGSAPPARSASRTRTASSRPAGNGNSGASRRSATKISHPVWRHSQAMNSPYIRGEVPM